MPFLLIVMFTDLYSDIILDIEFFENWISIGTGIGVSILNLNKGAQIDVLED